MRKKIWFLLSILLLATAVPAVIYRFIEAPSWQEKVNLLGFFTILSNLMVIMIVFLTLLGRTLPMKWKLSAGASITITALIFQLFLKEGWNPQGISALAANINHGSTTILFLFWYWLSQDQEPLTTKDLPAVVPFPALYALLGIIEGFFTGEPRYFFLDPLKMGWSLFFLWILGIAVLFLVTGLIIIGIDVLFHRPMADHRMKETV